MIVQRAHIKLSLRIKAFYKVVITTSTTQRTKLSHLFTGTYSDQDKSICTLHLLQYHTTVTFARDVRIIISKNLVYTIDLNFHRTRFSRLVNFGDFRGTKFLQMLTFFCLIKFSHLYIDVQIKDFTNRFR